MYYQVFIRPTAGTAGSATATHTLEEYDQLDLVDEALSLIFADPKIRALADGTGRVTEETLNFECGSLRVDKVEYDYLRDIFNNTLSDVLLYSPGSDPAAIEAIGIRLHVKLLAQAKDDCLIQISGLLNVAPEKSDTRVAVVADLTLGADILICTVLDVDGNPLSGVEVTGGVALFFPPTDKDGRAIASGKEFGNIDFSASKAGYTFPSTTVYIPGIGDIVEFTIQAIEK